MHRSSLRSRSLVAGALALAALVAACGGVSPAASALASSAGSSAGASAGASAGVPMLDVRVGAPYSLADLPASMADPIQAGIEKDLGVYGKAVHVSVREVQQAGTSAAYLLVVAFPSGTLNDNIYGQVITDLSEGAESNFTPRLIGAVSVSFGTMSGGSVAVFRKGDLVLVTMSPASADLTPVVKALVGANG